MTLFDGAKYILMVVTNELIELRAPGDTILCWANLIIVGGVTGLAKVCQYWAMMGKEIIDDGFYLHCAYACCVRYIIK